MLLKGLWSLSVCLKKVSSLISKKLPLSHMKRSHCQISSVHTQGLLEKCPTEFVRIATKKFLYARHALALKFTIFMYLQKKTIYLPSVVLENPCWNFSCITKLHQFSSKEHREAKCLQNRNKHTNLIQGWFRALWHHPVFLAVDNYSFPTSFTNKLHTFSTAKRTCTFLSCWTVFCKEAHQAMFLGQLWIAVCCHLPCRRRGWEVWKTSQEILWPL